MADQKITALTENTTPLGTDLLAIVDDPGASPATQKITLANAIAGFLQSCELANEVKNFPANVGIDIDLVAASQWWDTVGTPSTACTMVDVAGEGGITETWEYALKVIADGATEGFYQRFTYAAEPRVKLGRSLSAIAAVWVVTAGKTVTMKLVTSAATEVSATATAQAWTIIKCENLTLDGTYVDLQFTIDDADTFYVVPLGVSIGTKALPLPPRKLRYRWLDGGTVVKDLSGLADEAAWTDMDCTAATSNLAMMAYCIARVSTPGTGNSWDIRARRNGSSTTDDFVLSIKDGGSAQTNDFQVILDDGQIVEYYLDRTAGTNTMGSGRILVRGWWEWA